MNHLKFYKIVALGLLSLLAFSNRADAQACSTSNEVTITVVNDPTISITGASTICSGGTATLTATVAGGTGTCTIQWQSSPDGSTAWANISGANGTTYAPTSLTATTYYRATYSCTGLACDAATSNTQALTVNPDLTIQTQPQPIIECVGGTLSMNVVTTGTSGTGTLSYLWEQSANGTTGWTGALGATNSATYTPPSTTAGTTYYRVTVSATGNGCDPVVSANAKVDIIPDLTVQTQPSPIIECVGGTTSMTVVLTAGTGTGTISYSWEQSVDGSTGWGPALGGTNSATYTPPSTTAGTMYYRAVASATGNGCGPITCNSAKVDIIPDLTVQTQPSPITECVGGTLTMNVVLTAGTGTGTISYSWQESLNGTTGWGPAAGGTNSATYTPPSTTAGTMYYRVIASATGDGCGSVTSGSAKADIISDLTIQTQPTPIVECVGGTTTMSVVVTAGTGTGTVSYVWEQSANGTTGWGAALGGTNSATYTPPSTTAGTMYYRVIVSSTGNGCGSTTSNATKVDIIPDLTIQTQPSPIVECVGGTTTMSVVLTAGTGTGTISYLWEQSANGTTGWGAALGGTNSATYTPPSTTAGTMYYRVTASATGDGCGSVTSGSTKVDIIPDLTIQTQPSPITECVGGNTSMSVVLTAGTGTGTISYSWEQSANGTTGWTTALGSTNSATYTPPSTTAGTMYYRVIASATGDGCGSVTSSNAKVDIIDDIVITAQPQNITECIGGTLPLSITTTGGIGTTYQWEVSSNGTTGWAAIPGATATSYIPPSTASGTLYYHVVVSSASNGCGPQTSNTATVVIVAKPTVAVTTPNQIVCIGAVLTMNATPSGGTGTCTVQWQNSTDAGATWAPISGATGNSYITPALAANTKYRATFSCNGNGCCN
jgi:large repetitive protein